MAETNVAFKASSDEITVTVHQPSTRHIGNVRGSTVSFHNLNYTVEVPKPCCRSFSKQILYDVSGIFRPGMNAIMGPTGSGKTTLLDILADRSERSGIEGHLLIDGQKRPKNYKCMTGYVVQDDVVMGTLTVRENLMFSANLRLPQSKPLHEREEIVDEAIRELGLQNCANTKVGTEFIRGVSGGERKRTNIGMELIISPSILFLDEPTTGLDANTANSVMSLLQRLSRKGNTIIFSIHQPRFSIFRLFDRLSLLAAGRTVYHGESTEALEFFRRAGYECEEYNNPPDFFLDVINGDTTAIGAQAEDSYVDNKNNSELSALEMQTTSLDQKPKDIAQDLVAMFRESPWNQRLTEDLSPILTAYLSGSADDKDNSVPNHPHYATSFPTQLKYVSKRAFTNFLRNPQSSIMQNAVSIFFGVVLGLIFLQLGPTNNQSRFGALFFLTVNQLFSNLSAIEIFIHERVIFAHESASGFYRVSAYFFSKLFCDLIPMRLIPLTFFTVIVYFMIGFQVDAGKFFIFFLHLLTTTIAASAIAFTVSASIRTFAVANLLTVLVYIISMIFGGLLANLKEMGAWLNWLQYLSIVRYCLNALVINEFVGLHKTSGNDNNWATTTVATNYTNPCNSSITSIEDFLNDQGIAHETSWDLWRNFMALAIIAIGVEILAYIQLRRMKKLK